jgi:SAM-dependent methyltransferase
MLEPSAAKLNLGCHRNAMSGWINVDIEPYDGVDLCTDLNAPWPWPDNSIDYIRAYDIVEHLTAPIHTMNEAWRVLKPFGAMEILVPSTDGRGAFQDPTHVSFWNANTFAYFTRQGAKTDYPSIIGSFDVTLCNTPGGHLRMIHVWALCRALKPLEGKPAVPRQTVELLCRRAESYFKSKPIPFGQYYQREHQPTRDVMERIHQAHLII